MNWLAPGPAESTGNIGWSIESKMAHWRSRSADAITDSIHIGHVLQFPNFRLHFGHHPYQLAHISLLLGNLPAGIGIKHPYLQHFFRFHGIGFKKRVERLQQERSILP